MKFLLPIAKLAIPRLGYRCLVDRCLGTWLPIDADADTAETEVLTQPMDRAKRDPDLRFSYCSPSGDSPSSYAHRHDDLRIDTYLHQNLPSLLSSGPAPDSGRSNR